MTVYGPRKKNKPVTPVEIPDLSLYVKKKTGVRMTGRINMGDKK